LVGHQEEHAACKKLSDEVLCGCLSGAGANDLHMVQLMLLPPYHLYENGDWFVVQAYPGCPGKET